MPWGGERDLLELQDQLPLGRIPSSLHFEFRRSCLVIPTLEPLRIETEFFPIFSGTIHDGLHEVFCGGRRSIKTTHVGRHATHEPLLAQQGVQHAD